MMTARKKTIMKQVLAALGLSGGGLSIAGLVWALLKVWPILYAVADTVPQVTENCASIKKNAVDIIEVQKNQAVSEARSEVQQQALLDKIESLHVDVRALH